jgi:hypothetical protein
MTKAMGDYADLIKRLRNAQLYTVLHGEAADAIATLTRERDNWKAHAISRGKRLRQARNRFICIKDEIEDEGDRVYFGSSNHADDFRQEVTWLDDFAWGKIIGEPENWDLLGALEKQTARADKAEVARDAAVADRDAEERERILLAKELDKWKEKAGVWLNATADEKMKVQQLEADIKHVQGSDVGMMKIMQKAYEDRDAAISRAENQSERAGIALAARDEWEREALALRTLLREAELAIKLLLNTPEIADCDPRDKDTETQIAERKARNLAARITAATHTETGGENERN